MTHDSLCPSAKECNCTHIECCACHESVWCQCYLIAKVRTDEREQESARRAAKFGYWHDYRPEMP